MIDHAPILVLVVNESQIPCASSMCVFACVCVCVCVCVLEEGREVRHSTTVLT